ncbi:MAG TPA: Lrp/AsnC family transcriptional regulator [Xanthomonadales bacterium]|nr:Lrp/AsnC family transcriptional regulator [Xanthomonadales bacterium]
MTKPRNAGLDALDRRLLALWQRDTRRSAESLGEEIGLSGAAVHRRLKRLRDDGVIAAEVALLDPAAVGAGQACVVAVDVEREGLIELERFERRMLALPQVQQCWYVTGQSDFVLVVVTPDVASYEAFTREHLLSDANVKSFTTHVVLKRVKSSLELPIPEEEE